MFFLPCSSEDGSSGTSTPPPGGSMLHDHNHNQPSPPSHVGGGTSPSPFNPSPAPAPASSSAPTPPWKVGVAAEKRPSPTASPTRFQEQRSTPWRNPTGDSRPSADPTPTATPPWKAGADVRAGSPRQGTPHSRKEEEEEPKFGYVDPHIQSKTFRLLQTKLETGQGKHCFLKRTWGIQNCGNFKGRYIVSIVEFFKSLN